MSHVTNADLRKVLCAVEILNSGHGMETLAERTLSSVESLIPSSSMTAFDDICTDGEYAGNFWYSPPGTVSQESVKTLGELLHQHPCTRMIAETKEARIFRTSDYLPLPKFNGTALYNEFYRIFDGEAQLISAMRVSSARLVTCAFHRPKKDFTDREVETVTLFTPHLRAAFKNTQTFQQMARERRFLASVVNRGLAVLDQEGTLVFINEIAENLMIKYFVEFQPGRLPLKLREYIDSTLANFERDEYFSPADAIRIRQRNSELVIRVVLDHQARELTLLFEEKAARSICDFEKAGFTKREAEMLVWMSRGKTDGDIAALCEISIRTVQKHAENIYTKLGVENRTAAVMAAIEMLPVQ